MDTHTEHCALLLLCRFSAVWFCIDKSSTIYATGSLPVESQVMLRSAIPNCNRQPRRRVSWWIHARKVSSLTSFVMCVFSKLGSGIWKPQGPHGSNIHDNAFPNAFMSYNTYVLVFKSTTNPNGKRIIRICRLHSYFEVIIWIIGYVQWVPSRLHGCIKKIRKQLFLLGMISMPV